MTTTTKKSAISDGPRDDDQSFGAEDVEQKHTTAELLLQAFHARPKLNRAALDVYVAILELGTTCYQEDIADHAEMTTRNVRRGLRTLEDAFLIVTTQIWNRGHIKNTYQITTNSHRTTLSGGPNSHRTELSDHETGQKSPIHDVMHDVEMTEKLDLLNFLDWGERLKRCGQKHCTLDYAKAWRKWWNRQDFGWRKEPAAWANKQIRLGHPSPPPQMNLPASSLDLTTGHHWTPEDLELMNSNPPAPGMKFNPATGTWS